MIDFFLHIPKCGGSSIRTLLTQNYSSDRTIGFSGDWKAILWFRCLSTEQKNAYSIVHGHFPWNMHHGMPSGYRYFTFLRDPVERHFSDYFYQRRWPDSTLHRSIVEGKLSVEQWADVSTVSPGLQNCLVRYVVDDLFSASAPASYAPFGFERMRKDFAAFGLVERFNESVLLIAKALGWKNVVYELRNVTEQKEEVSPALKKRFADQISVDLDFYSRCRALFEERVAEAGNLLGDAVGELEGLCMRAKSDAHAHDRFVVGEDVVRLSTDPLAELGSASALRRWLDS